MVAPAFLMGLLAVTALSYTTEFFLCDEPLPNVSGNLVQTVTNFLTFQACPDVPDWLGFALFALVGLPWFFVLAEFLVPIIAGAVSSTAGLVVVGTLVLVALVGVFTLLLV